MNKEELKQLINNLKIDKEEFWILSSSALVLRDLLPKANDLDIAVTEEGFRQLNENYNIIRKENGMYQVLENVECFIDKKEDGGIDFSHLHKLGFQTAAMALDDRAISIDNPILSDIDKLAIVLGTEGDGLAKFTISNCDYTVRIPMAHGVDSLNVAAAGAVAFWQLG